jgi:hypothetical protein
MSLKDHLWYFWGFFLLTITMITMVVFMRLTTMMAWLFIRLTRLSRVTAVARAVLASFLPVVFASHDNFLGFFRGLFLAVIDVNFNLWIFVRNLSFFVVKFIFHDFFPHLHLDPNASIPREPHGFCDGACRGDRLIQLEHENFNNFAIKD